MQCENCGAEMENGCDVCPNCGQLAEQKSPSNKGWRIAMIVAASLTGLVLLVLLVGIVNYGVTGRFLPKSNDIFYKQRYTVTQEKLSTAGGNKKFQKQMDNVIATMGEDQLTNRLLQMYFWAEVNSSQYSDLDSTKPLHEQIQDPETGKTWEQFFVEKAISAWQKDMILCGQAEAANYQMPESYTSQFATLKEDLDAQAVNNGYASGVAMLQERYGVGCNFDAYYTYVWNYYYGTLYLMDAVEKATVTQQEIEAYYEANKTAIQNGYQMEISKESGYLVDVRHILVKPKGGTLSEDGKTTTYSEEEWEACRAAAQALLDQYLAGDLTEESFAKLAAEKTEDPGSMSTGGLYEYVYKGQMVEPFEQWCFDASRKTGDTGLVKTTYGYHVMYYVYGEDGWIRVSRAGAQNQKVGNEMDALLESSSISINYKLITLADVEQK